jgi:uncharacterized protein (UPF0335 family)
MTDRRHFRQLLAERFAACDEAVERINAEKAKILKQADGLGIDRGDVRRIAVLHRQDERRARADRRFEQAVQRILGRTP